MKNRQFVLTCGRVVYMREYTVRDIPKRRKKIITYIHKHRKALQKLSTYYMAGKNKDRLAVNVLSKFSTHLMSVMVDEMMKGNRIQTFENHYWVIGDVGYDKWKFDWETNGKKFGIKIQNLPSKYVFRMSKVRREELQRRIKTGQSYPH